MAASGVKGSKKPNWSFLMNSAVHLRYSRFSTSHLVHVKGISYQESGNIFVVQWIKGSEQGSIQPPVGQELEIFAIHQGVLLMTKGKVLDTTPGKLPRIRIQTATTATSIALRKHQRFLVRGKLNMGPPGSNFTYMQNTDHEMDISEGGFGMRLPLIAWKAPEISDFSGGDDAITRIKGGEKSVSQDVNTDPDETRELSLEESDDNADVPDDQSPGTAGVEGGEAKRQHYVRIELTIYAEKDGKINTQMPYIVIDGQAIVRRRSPVKGANEEFVGFQFDERKTNLDTLKLWLATNSLSFREA